MAEAQDAVKGDSNKEKVVLAEIEPVKLEANSTDVTPSNTADGSNYDRNELEKSLIAATILLLREYGIRKVVLQ